MSTKKWSFSFLVLVLLLLMIAASTTGIIDPFFHYHAPLKHLEYPITLQRYQNDGIIRNFSYDALITGTSMAENFKASEFDALFDSTTIKVCFSGGTYEEITTSLEKALQYNPKIRYVVYSIEEWFVDTEKDLIQVDGKYPTYLYDANPFNDVQYLLNKEILFYNTLAVLDYTHDGHLTTTFDEYSSWDYPTGRDVLLNFYVRPDIVENKTIFSPDLAQALREKLEISLLPLAREYPETQFLLFFPPYSILNWDARQRVGNLDMHIDAMVLISEILTQADNIHLFSFNTDFDLITDLNQYKDTLHYHSGINSLLLQRMRRDEYRLTPENYQAHWDEVRDFYSNYDYEAIFAE